MMPRNRIRPSLDLHSVLQSVENPGRYVGGEWGSIKSDGTAEYRVALTFPDLYEVGMSNTAIKILYGLLNSIPGVACERVFVPAPDFELALQEHGVPLYTLETGIPLFLTDMLAVSFGYELLATNLLTLLKSGGIPVRAQDRTETDPLVVLGGPGATNPAPLSQFIDGVLVGEAEGVLTDIMTTLADLKRKGARREDRLEVLRQHPAIWYPGVTRTVRRTIWNGFGLSKQPAYGVGFPVPSMPIIQDHGVVEIMRGCPQGCRFCHAGVFYRPYRMKDLDTVLEEVRWLVENRGYREISLSSLSTGDYHDLETLVTRLSDEFGHQGVSFSLPSLRVNSVTLPLLELISRGKRSGLTFAVESPDERSQRVVNKLVPLERVIEIATEARDRGWRHAKLYFMIGLPVPDSQREGEKIAEYVTALRKAVPLEYVVNVGSFVPKPHTPFQRVRQITPVEATRQLESLRSLLPRGTKLRAHNPENSWLEGLLARGNETTGDLIAAAHDAGARLDAWDEYANIDVWKSIIHDHPEKMSIERALGPFGDGPLPWSDISLGVTNRYLDEEYSRASSQELTSRCVDGCVEPCGVCNRIVKVRDLDSILDNSVETVDASNANASNQVAPNVVSDGRGSDGHGSDGHGRSYQLVINYQKRGSAAFLSHLALVRTFERVWNRLGIPLALSEGYHTKPKMSFGQPLPLGCSSEDEVIIVNVQNNIQFDNVWKTIPSVLPDGFSITGMILLHHEKGSQRIPSPMQQYAGSLYRIRIDQTASQTDNGTNQLDKQADIETLKVLKEHGIVPDEPVLLDSNAPGLGRILKAAPDRKFLIAERLAMYARVDNGLRLFDFYRDLPNAIAVREGEPGL